MFTLSCRPTVRSQLSAADVGTMLLKLLRVAVSPTTAARPAERRKALTALVNLAPASENDWLCTGDAAVMLLQLLTESPIKPAVLESVSALFLNSSRTEGAYACTCKPCCGVVSRGVCARPKAWRGLMHRPLRHNAHHNATHHTRPCTGVALQLAKSDNFRLLCRALQDGAVVLTQTTLTNVAKLFHTFAQLPARTVVPTLMVPFPQQGHAPHRSGCLHTLVSLCRRTDLPGTESNAELEALLAALAALNALCDHGDLQSNGVVLRELLVACGAVEHCLAHARGVLAVDMRAGYVRVGCVVCVVCALACASCVSRV